MPGAYARTSTQALTSVTLPYLQALALDGVFGAVASHPELLAGINCQGGRLTCEEVATTHRLPFVAPEA
jgi:alanine dehydrogenase